MVVTNVQVIADLKGHIAAAVIEPEPRSIVITSILTWTAFRDKALEQRKTVFSELAKYTMTTWHV